MGEEKVGQMDNGKGGVEQKEPGEPKEKGGSDSGQEKQEKPCGQANDSVYFSADDTL